MEKQMKENFERFKMDIVAFAGEDIITTSGGDKFEPGENEGPFVPATLNN